VIADLAVEVRTTAERLGRDVTDEELADAVEARIGTETVGTWKRDGFVGQCVESLFAEGSA
jgi:hypothetical protein